MGFTLLTQTKLSAIVFCLLRACLTIYKSQEWEEPVGNLHRTSSTSCCPGPLWAQAHDRAPVDVYAALS